MELNPSDTTGTVRQVVSQVYNAQQNMCNDICHVFVLQVDRAPSTTLESLDNYRDCCFPKLGRIRSKPASRPYIFIRVHFGLIKAEDRKVGFDNIRRRLLSP